MIDFIFNDLWYVLIFACIFVALIYPTIEGKICALLFCLIAYSPEWTGAEEMLYCAVCAIFASTGIVLLQFMQPYSKYSFKISCMLLVEILMNMIGIVIWFFEVSRNISQAMYDFYGYEISPLFIYEISFLIFYFVAIFILFDRRGRKNAVGSGVFQFVGDYILSPFIRFKGSSRWMA